MGLTETEHSDIDVQSADERRFGSTLTTEEKDTAKRLDEEVFGEKSSVSTIERPAPKLSDLPMGTKIIDDAGQLWMKIDPAEAPYVPDSEKAQGIFKAVGPEGSEYLHKSMRMKPGTRIREYEPIFRTHFWDGHWKILEIIK